MTEILLKYVILSDQNVSDHHVQSHGTLYTKLFNFVFLPRNRVIDLVRVVLLSAIPHNIFVSGTRLLFKGMS